MTSSPNDGSRTPGGEKSEAAKTTVLVVDDSVPVAEMLRVVLIDAGYRVVVANDGETALEAARAEQPDIILMDWTLPDADGVQLLKQMHGFLDVPSIMITGRSDPDSCVLALDAGCDDFILKPIREPELLLRIARLLDRSPD